MELQEEVRGYYGGTTNNVRNASSGAGGSSYISGHDGCNSTDTEGNPTGDSIHTSGLLFKDTVMIDGEGYEWTNTRQNYVQMESPQGNYVTGNNQDGYARITLLEDPSQNNLLKEIQINKGTITPEVNYDTTEYTVNLNPEDTTLTIYGVVDDIKATVEGNGTYDILPGENTITLKVTAESGDEKIYIIKAIREASNNSKPINITINGLIESIINVNPKYGKLIPEQFDPDVHQYSMIVPSRIKKLEFEVEKGHNYQIVTGDGTRELSAGDNEIIIEVTSEDGSSKDTYTYNITRDMTGNCLLESLSIDNVETDMVFNQDTLEYFVIVENEITHLDITAIPEMKEITPIITGNEDLKVGLNDIYIIVTAPNGEQLVYIIHAYRKQSGNVFLSSLDVKNGDEKLLLDPEYNKILNTYIVTVPNEVEKVNIDAIPEVNTSKLSGTGEKTLKAGTNTYKIEVTAEDGSKGIYTININRAQSSNNYLKELITTAGEFNIKFDKTINEYEITVPSGVKNIPLIIETEDKTAKYKVLQNQNFVTGDNTVIVRVTAENGEQRDYKINVKVEPSSNNYLSNIITSNGTLEPTFNKENTSYTLEVENEIENIEVKATKEVASSLVTGEGIYKLEIGNNEISIEVQAENGDTRTYKIVVTRKLSSNTRLLKVENNKDQIVTKTDDSTYQINVKNEIDEIEITGIPENETSSVTGNGKYELEIGENVINLTVTSQSGTSKEYSIIINRAKSDNNYLKFLFAYEGELYETFEKTKTEYTIKVQEKVQSLTLEIETEDKNATYEVIGNENFVYGENKVIIRVTASDGMTTKDYTLTVYRQPDLEKSCDLTNITVDKGTLTPTFDANTLVYEVNVPFEDKIINVGATALDNTATITGTGEYNLEVGLNIVTIKVTSSEKNEKVYQIRITRKKSNNANLSSLEIQNHTISPEFNPNNTTYTLETKLNELVIYAKTAEEDATYEIIGNKDLEKGINQIIIKVTAPDGKTIQNYILKTMKTGSDNNNLEYLSVYGYELTPAFNKNTLLYSTDVPNNIESVYIDAKADDRNATISGNGIANLKEGKNTFEIIVTSETGKEKKYTVIINRSLSDNAYLSELKCSQGSLTPKFEKTTNEYKVEVEYEIENIAISAYAEDSNSTVYGNGNYSLKVGNNKIEITVTSASGKKNIYTINVERKTAVSAKLAKLEIEIYEIEPKYNQNTNEYFVKVDNEITNLNMIIETLDPKATYIVTGNENFIIGNNEVTIEVTSSDGITKELYTIQVDRQISSNNYLSYILPSEGVLTPKFEKTTNNYTVTVENEITQINIDADTEDSNSTMIGTGNYTLEVGENKVKIEVTSTIGIKRDYIVTVIRKKNSNNYLKNLIAKLGSQTVEITPIFNKETNYYEINVPTGTTKIQFIGETENNLSTVTGLEYISLKVGKNTHIIQVTAEDSSIRNYEIVINREASNINDLIDLIPSTGTLSPSFSYGVLEYDLTLGDDDYLLSFEVNMQDRFSTVTGNEEQEVPDGESIRKIVVTAENGETKTYTININRIRTNDARLINLTVKSYTLDQEFNSDIYEYTLTVPNDKFILTENEIVAKPLYADTQVFPDISIELSVLKLNTYLIKTIAPDGYTTQTYKINVTRQKSNNSSLQKLSVSGYEITPNFESSTLQYNVTVPKGTTIFKAENVIAIPTDEYATVVKSVDTQLKNGKCTYDINVTSHDGTSHTNYKIFVETAKSDNNYLKSLTTNVGTLSPTFDTNITQYSIHLTQRQDTITINASTEDELATIIKGTGTYEITEENTRIIVMVQAENETLRAYIIDITKDPKTETTIEGKITTENTSNKYIANIKLYKEETLIFETETNEDGTYKLYAKPDKYKVVIEKEGYLDTIIENILIENIEQKIQLDTYNLIAGDIIKTGEIEIDDLVALNSNYGEITTANKSDKSKYDLNEDGIVNKLDRNILKENYEKTAEIIQWIKK